METQARKQDGLFRFLGLTLALSSAYFIAAAIIFQPTGITSFILALGLMWCPGIAAVLALRSQGLSLHELGLRWPARRFIVIAGAWAFLALMVSQFLAVVFGLAGFRWPFTTMSLVLWLLAFVISLVLALPPRSAVR